MKILIIGGTGYIGARLFSCFKKYFDVETVDLEWFGNFNNPNNIKTDYKNLSEDFLVKFDVVILLAGLSGVKMCEDDPEEVFDHNIARFVSLVSKLKKNQKFIYASSSSVYGSALKSIVNEDYFYYKSNNLYDVSKKMIDLYIERTDNCFYSLRLGTVNGYSPNLRVDLMINSMVVSAIENGKITISNKDVHRPIIGIRDLCGAIFTIINSNIKPGLYNLCSFNSTVGEIAKDVSDILKSNIVETNCPSLIENYKTQSNVYDFSISNEKFKKESGYCFNDTVSDIVNDLMINRMFWNKTNRTLKHP